MDLTELITSVSLFFVIGLLFYRIYKISIKEKEAIVMPFIYFGLATIFNSLLFIVSILNFNENLYLILMYVSVFFGAIHLLMTIIEIIVLMLVPLGSSHYDPNK